jgi:hypothetical protein
LALSLPSSQHLPISILPAPLPGGMRSHWEGREATPSFFPSFLPLFFLSPPFAGRGLNANATATGHLPTTTYSVPPACTLQFETFPLAYLFSSPPTNVL